MDTITIVKHDNEASREPKDIHLHCSGKYPNLVKFLGIFREGGGRCWSDSSAILRTFYCRRNVFLSGPSVSDRICDNRKTIYPDCKAGSRWNARRTKMPLWLWQYFLLRYPEASHTSWQLAWPLSSNGSSKVLAWMYPS
ncbi:hypothetical protein AVEN_143044-1 [Araneus ventricosus]|uniref:Uncharacterized protein n=1 Tax=Araneus ventricosus TaxID=182803 RepID=A0A4Y2WBT3_ARAVE|nr:hypothetical protein AVEN_143044-1 [Araneus ventricosus]